MSDIQYVTLPKFDSFEDPLHIAVFKDYAATFEKLKIRKLENRKVGIWNHLSQSKVTKTTGFK